MLLWQELACLDAHSLAALDVAEINLACASGLPGSERLDIAHCLRTLDEWAEHVRHKTIKLLPRFRKAPADFENSEPYFRILVMVTVLRRDIGISYNKRYKQEQLARGERIDAREFIGDGFFLDSRNLFLHGIVETKEGTCSSLPPLYVAIGRRLGYPLKVVSTKGHLFARWDDVGVRFNIECTCEGLYCHTDEHYLHWPFESTPEEAKRCGYLTSKTPMQELATFLESRGHCWLENKQHRQAADAFATAGSLDFNALNLLCLEATLNRWNQRMKPRRRRYPGLPARIEDHILGLELAEDKDKLLTTSPD
jgi:hypothetical protein